MGEMIKSPLSSKPPERVRELPRSMLLRELGNYFGARPTDDVVSCDYSLWRCVETGFEFAEPRTAGNSRFYEWISSFPIYYPKTRWEYGKLLDLVSHQIGSSDGGIRLLDVGCGSGEFLQLIASRSRADCFGVDMNPSAIERCKQRGLKVHCGMLSDALACQAISTSSFDYVTSFHCLEHVPDPVGFISEMVPLLSQTGRILVSTPFSPMSFETDWFDVMNHPPHHLGRWNVRAYRKLAEVLGLEFSYYMPRAGSAFSRARQTFQLMHLGAHRNIGRLELMGMLVRRFASFITIWRHQLKRPKIDGNTAADVILVELRRK